MLWRFEGVGDRVELVVEDELTRRTSWLLAGDAEGEPDELRRVGGRGERSRERESRDRLLERSLIFSLMAPKKCCSAEGTERGIGLLKGSVDALVEAEDWVNVRWVMLDLGKVVEVVVVVVVSIEGDWIETCRERFGCCFSTSTDGRLEKQADGVFI